MHTLLALFADTFSTLCLADIKATTTKYTDTCMSCAIINNLYELIIKLVLDVYYFFSRRTYVKVSEEKLGG